MNTPFTRDMGQGAQHALMIHCMLAHSRAWAGLSQHLGDYYQMHAFDLPGHGRAAPWDGRVELQLYAAQMAHQVMDGRPMDIIGHSFGATVALRLAVLFPQLVQRLVLVEPVFFAAARDGSARVDALLQAEHDRCAAQFAAGDYMGAAQRFFAFWGDGPAVWAKLPQAKRDMIAGQMRLIEATGTSVYDDAPGLLRPGVLDRLDIPVLLVEGEQSPPIIAAINNGLQNRLPNVQRAQIAGAGHMAPLTHPADCAQVIRRFVEK